MESSTKRIIFLYLALHTFADLVLAIIVYLQGGEFIVSFGIMLVFSIFILLLYFGIRNEEFRGRYGSRVILWREPVAYWLCFAFIVLFHVMVTVLIAMTINW